MKKIIGLLLAVVLLLSFGTACSEKGVSIDEILEDTNVEIGSVGNERIYAYEMIYFLRAGSSLEDAKSVLVQTKVLKSIAAAQNITFTDEMQAEIDSYLEETEAQLGSKEVMEKQLQEIGVTLDQYTSMLKDSLLAESVASQVIELGIVAEPTDEEAKQFFDDNMLKAKHILFSTVGEDGTTPLEADQIEVKMQLAEETLSKIKGGESFDSYASLNEDPGAAQSPEGYVFVDTNKVTDQATLSYLNQIGIGVMVEEFTNGAAGIEVGGVTDLVESSFGYHIINRVELTDADYDMYKDSLKQILSSVNFNKYLEEEEAKLPVAWKDNLVAPISENIQPLEVQEQPAAQAPVEEAPVEEAPVEEAPAE